jgi:benzoyl-CoA reductase/2-hydroxyglutaryl-CoA dehydratase subunit BcrC/BadD/HgdB
MSALTTDQHGASLQQTKQAQFKGARSIKRLASSSDATKLNRAYLERMWGDIADGASFVFGYGPMELFNAMDLYLVLPVQYGSVMAAKQQFDHYQGAIEDRGYFRSLASYESLPLGYCFDRDPTRAPYGGLPKPAAVVGGYMTDPAIYELYARELGSPLFLMEDPHQQEQIKARWWENEFRDPGIVDFSVNEFKRCVRFLESVTGKPYSETKMRDYLARADEMCRLYDEISSLAYETPGPAPYTATDAYAEVAIFETHFGHEWALDHVKKLHQEVKERVENGVTAVPHERTRILWTGTPLWFNLGFYNAWEESHGAIFVETMYLPRAKRLIQPDTSDALRATFLRRHMKYTGPSPRAAAELLLHQVRQYRIDAVILPSRGATREASASSHYMAAALRKAGIPAMVVDYSPFGASEEEGEAMHARVTEFIESVQAAA